MEYPVQDSELQNPSKRWPVTKYPIRHISIRVPWHDTGWHGIVCNAPRLNGACLKLPRIAESRVDAKEEAVAGQSLETLSEAQWPCCVGERTMFMAPFELLSTKHHPYARSSVETHGHFAPTTLRQPSYAAPVVPFRWMNKGKKNDSFDFFAREYDLRLDIDREPELSFETSWVQDIENQTMLLDTFAAHLRETETLCFFYAKQVPFVDDPRRVLIGVGRVKHIGGLTEYCYTGKTPPLRCVLWERMIQHSIRPDFHDGFLLPYHAALALAEKDPGFDPASVAAFAPNESFVEFSYASEHVSNSSAITALLTIKRSLETSQNAGIERPWPDCVRWVDNELGRLWKLRDPCPGLGAALGALGIELSHLIAHAIQEKAGENTNPWPTVEKTFRDPKSILTKELAEKIGKTTAEIWKQAPKARKELLRLVSRFEMSIEQARLVYLPEERDVYGLDMDDEEILRNPYLIYEKTRPTALPISAVMVDKGVFLSTAIQTAHPLEPPSAMDTALDPRRQRALAIASLEAGAAEGHTLVARDDISRRVRDMPLDPVCPMSADSLRVAEKNFADTIDKTQLDDGADAYQLTRFTTTRQIIADTVLKRLGGKKHVIAADWRKLLDKELEGKPKDALESRAREEKAAAIAQLAHARFAVLIGPAGTGKTTLLSILCRHSDISAGGILLLAPTGKARVQMEKMARGVGGAAKTIAQFLNENDRYDANTGRYFVNPTARKDSSAKTVIVDESSMLTEEMLAALIDALSGVQRLILVGDHKQLPPIGAGRPFVDIVQRLAPEKVETMVPKIADGYAELTIPRRHLGKNRDDLRLTEWFSGRPVPPADDDIFDQLATGSTATPSVAVRPWKSTHEVRDLMLDVMRIELDLANVDDHDGFDRKLGGTLFEGTHYFHRERAGAAAKAES